LSAGNEENKENEMSVYTKDMRFRRMGTGVSRHDGETNSYMIERINKEYVLTIYRQDRSVSGLVLLGAQIEDSFGPVKIRCDQRREAVAIARAYEELGDDYRASQHGYASRVSTAIARGYAAFQ
jgi:hypothetical protein